MFRILARRVSMPHETSRVVREDLESRQRCQKREVLINSGTLECGEAVSSPVKQTVDS